MKLLRQNFQIDNNITKHQRNVIRLIVALFFSEIVLAILGGPLPQNSFYKVYLVFSFGSVLVAFLSVFLMRGGGRLPKNFLWIIVFTVFSLLLGIINGWNIIDILADAGRFIAPFLAYYVGKNLFSRLSFKEIKVATMLILQGLFFVFLLSLAMKFFRLFVMGDPFVKYPDGGVDVPLLLISFLVVSWFFLPASPRFSRFVLFLLFVMLLSPLMSASKSSFITVCFFLIFTPIVYGRFRHSVLALIFILMGVALVINSDTGMFIIDRFVIAFEVVVNGSAEIGDMSSYARVVEANSALEGLNSSWFYPLSYLFGNGSGALWYTAIGLDSGLNEENFRLDGGAHHIHIEILSLLFRHGLIGLSMYLSWMIFVCWRAHKVSRYFVGNDVFFMSISATVVVVVIAAFLTMLTDTSIYGHFYVGLIAAAPVVIHKRVSREL